MGNKLGALALTGALVVGGAVALVGLPAISSAQTGGSAATAKAGRHTKTVDRLVQDGTLTEDQGNKVSAAFDADRGPGRGPGGRHIEHLAAAIGVDAAALKAGFAAGQTPAQLAEANGVSVEDLVDRLVASMESHVGEKVAAGEITRDEADAKLAGAKERITAAVNGTAPGGRAGHGGRHGGPGRFGDREGQRPDRTPGESGTSAGSAVQG